MHLQSKNKNNIIQNYNYVIQNEMNIYQIYHSNKLNSISSIWSLLFIYFVIQVIFETGFDSFINYVIQGEFPIEIKTGIRYLIICCSLNFTL